MSFLLFPIRGTYNPNMGQPGPAYFLSPKEEIILELFLWKLWLNFFVAFGIIMGGCLLAGISSVILLRPPSSTMMSIADNIKVWAMVAAVGGTIDPFRVIEANFAEGYLSPAFKQIIFFIGAFAGAQVGYELIRMICKGGVE